MLLFSAVLQNSFRFAVFPKKLITFNPMQYVKPVSYTHLDVYKRQGCKSCHEQFEYTKQAVKDMGLSVEVEYITDMQKVMEYGVMSMPALVAVSYTHLVTVVSEMAGNLILQVKDSRIALDKSMANRVMI